VTLRIRPEAQSDLAEAYRWYSEQAADLGDELLAEVGNVLERIEKFPESYAKVHRDIRRALIRRFPYGVFYRAEPDSIIVLAVLHQARNPERWKRRT